ncbi:radical SAM protein [uncultured Bacteroides sp.]|uniref:radical SAM protein n=1 Tax=uncultured Bacteroides sp. TaxID=162156 RepID=UPI00263269F9|nr:radical SAM protein [uncultured Bacteroides sp.]
MVIAEKQTKDLLTSSKIGRYAINPYIGCPHACKYCYASFMKRFTNHPEPWGEFLDVKRCDKKIDLRKIDGKNVFMSTATDCYNPCEAKYQITRSILEQLVDSNCYLQISTKNKLILRDLDLLKRMKHISVAMSVNTLDEKFRHDMDKGSTISERLDTLRTFHDNGIYTILFMSPIFIYITDWKAIINQTKDFISEYWFEDLNLRGSYKPVIMRYIQENYPQYYDSYRRIYNEGNQLELMDMDREICTWCDAEHINYSAYFHHENVIKTEVNKILGKNNK